MSEQFEGDGEAFQNLLKTVAQLRDPLEGCPWDLEQDSLSLPPYLLEEAQEFMSSVQRNDQDSIVEELGDVFFQVVLHSQIAFEKKLFTVKQMCEKLNAKLIERHPHVFQDNKTSLQSHEVKKQWNLNKISKSGLDKLYDALKLPPILASQKIGNFSHGIGFDWENSDQVLLKVEEELKEIKEAIKNKSHKEELAEEIGDLLFSTIQLARHCDLSADYCLNLSNQKFQNRFELLYSMVKSSQKELHSMTLEEKEQYWSIVKNTLKSNKL